MAAVETLSGFRQGDTKKITINYGAGVDITGYEHFFTMRVDFEEVTPITAQVKGVAGGHPEDDVLNGIAVLELDSTTSIGIPVGAYVYDVQRVIPAGANPPKVLTLLPAIKDLQKPIVVSPHVTRITSV